MQHTAGNYEAFARPRPAQHAQETKAYIVGSGLAG
ncbi:myosin-crossreactive antigen [Brachybacterium muris]|nr:myosin-crossreactive antigen [Brachybacterium muris]